MDLTVIKTIFRIPMTILSTLFVRYHALPSLIFRTMMWFKRHRRGVKVEHVDCDGYRFSYFTRGQPGPRPSMLMLHGFSLDKNIWLNTIQLFPRNLHLICLDMPGHGETTRLLGESYTAAAQTKRIHQFVEAIGLSKKPFHLVGMSMGGMVAGVYAAQYPSEIFSLSLLCPAGLKYPTENEFFMRLKELIQAKNPEDTTLIPVTDKQSKHLFKLCLHRPNIINTQLLKAYLDDRRPHKMFFITCFLDVSSAKSRYSLHDNMSKIKAPTQIIWGRSDKGHQNVKRGQKVKAGRQHKALMLDKDQRQIFKRKLIAWKESHENGKADSQLPAAWNILHLRLYKIEKRSKTKSSVFCSTGNLIGCGILTIATRID
ncbi:monoacylglycerol lipase ABHD6-like [Podarcis raffonei]|uniref:monoacylglycerol lipase ABHD6-like n=1 Tax=Podarcis raffonei TaxID=65483 RepID=UPI0023296726|nr:monoacylglycerol lipase ABHD6-like [Podarcis raffonei]